MSIPYERSPDADPMTENDPSDRPLIEQDPEHDRALRGGGRGGPGYSEPDQGMGDAWPSQPNREDE
ncbi:MAG: hypothetical protein H7066_15530 [Cytophagaceae bacterium]|nr:hypothetical protein [Gemmatimonadaceae bacterium]